MHEVFTAEEAIAMLLKHLRDLAETQGKKEVIDIALTVPSYFSMAQRQMLSDAVELAGMNLVTLVHENVAAATMYGLDRKDENATHTVLFVNMGSLDVEVALVRYFMGSSKGEKKVEHIEVVAEAAEDSVGGRYFDVELVKLFAEAFNALPERKGKEDVMKNPRIVNRLLKESARYKEVLSANKEAFVNINEIADYVSLKMKLDRQTFEDKIAKYVDKAAGPIEKVLKKSGVTLDEIDQIEMLGGGIRVPAVQKIMQEKLSGRDMGQHMNGDEAMCFGTAFIAANSSAAFRVRSLLLNEFVD